MTLIFNLIEKYIIDFKLNEKTQITINLSPISKKMEGIIMIQLKALYKVFIFWTQFTSIAE